MRLIAILLIVVSFVACKSRPAGLSRQDFAQVFLDSLNNKFPDRHFQLQPDLKISSSKGNLDYKLVIENAYTEYKRAPDSLPWIMNKYTALTTELMTDAPVQVEHIVALIKPRSFRQEAKNGSFEPATDAYDDELLIAYAEDMKNNIRYLSESDLKELAIPRDSVYALAVRNLEKAVPGIELRGQDGLYGVLAGSDFEACLILVPSLWTKERFPVDGDFVVGIPNKDMLLVTGSNNTAGIEKLKAFVANSYKTRRYPVTEHLFKWNGTGFRRME